MMLSGEEISMMVLTRNHRALSVLYSLITMISRLSTTLIPCRGAEKNFVYTKLSSLQVNWARLFLKNGFGKGAGDETNIYLNPLLDHPLNRQHIVNPQSAAFPCMGSRKSAKQNIRN